MENLLRKIADMIFLTRLPLLIPVWTVLMLGWISARKGAPLLTLHAEPSQLWLTLFGFSLIVSFIYIVNQICDVESDRINNKLFILHEGHVGLSEAWMLAVICATAGMWISLSLQPRIAIVFSISLLLGIAYNLPPLSLKNRPIGGTVANFAGHGMLTFLAGYYAADPSASWQSGIVPSLSAGFANAAVYIVSTVADAEGDRQTGKHTWAVVFGAASTAWAALICCVAAFVAAFLIPQNAWVMIIPAALSVPVFGWFALNSERRFSFGTFRIPVVALTLAVAAFVPIYAAMVLVTLVASRIYYKLRFNYDYPSVKAQ